MNSIAKEKTFDAIIVGSGPGGATLAKELIRQKKKVLILERGGNSPLKETFWGTVSIANETAVGNKLKTMGASTTGGSTALYFAVAEAPPLDAFSALGIDLSRELEEVQRELPIAPLPDELIGAQAIRLRDSASALGYTWKKNDMLIDQSRCNTGYSYEAKWKARDYVQDAVQGGATLLSQAKVTRILMVKNKAVGVEYQIKKEKFMVYGEKIILAAGSVVSPIILRDSGVESVVNRGFYFDPNFVLMGVLPGLEGKDNFVGCMSAEVDDTVALGDANLSNTFYKMWMLGSFKLSRLFSFQKSIAIGVKVKDKAGGELDKTGRYHKDISAVDLKHLKRGEEIAIKILKNTGAKNIFHSGISAGNVSGTLKIREHVDEKLQTQYDNLYVCDASVLPDDVRVAPTITLVCLGKYLAGHLFV